MRRDSPGEKPLNVTLLRRRLAKRKEFAQLAGVTRRDPLLTALRRKEARAAHAKGKYQLPEAKASVGCELGSKGFLRVRRWQQLWWIRGRLKIKQKLVFQGFGSWARCFRQTHENRNNQNFSSPCLVTSWPSYHFPRITAPRVAYVRSCVSLHAQCPALAPDSQAWALTMGNAECFVVIWSPRAQCPALVPDSRGVVLQGVL